MEAYKPYVLPLSSFACSARAVLCKAQPTLDHDNPMAKLMLVLVVLVLVLVVWLSVCT